MSEAPGTAGRRAQEVMGDTGLIPVVMVGCQAPEMGRRHLVTAKHQLPLTPGVRAPSRGGGAPS